MRNQKEDRRSLRTRQVLNRTLFELMLEKRYDSITVQDIIDRANVGRSTFYAHFRDIDDLLLSQFDDLREKLGQYMADQSAPAVNPWELTLLIFQHAQQQHLLCKALMGERGGNAILDHIAEYFSELARKQFSLRTPGRNSRVALSDVLIHYFVSSFIALLTWWLDHDLPYSAEHMNDIFRELTGPGIESILEQMVLESS